MILALTLFLGAFLLFLVQPMIAKVLLPWFGGSSAMWTVCLLFFQTALLAGYVYAHFTRRGLHLPVLAFSLLFLPLQPVEPAIKDPAFAVFKVLALSVGLPYLVLASTSPLLQRWATGPNPYRLYALSNLASMTALAAYPFLIEPFIPLGLQMRIWSGAYAAFVLLCAAVTFLGREHAEPAAEPVSRAQIATWLALAGCGTGLLMATTNQMSQEIASIPLLWIIPLVIYLLTFVIVFERSEWYDRRTYALFGSIQIPLACAFAAAGGRIPMWLHLLTYTTALFVALMLVHGELALSKPAHGSLTRFYVAIAGGGALGGVFVALAAPRLFSTYVEFPLMLTLAAGLAVFQRWRAGEFHSFRQLPPLARASLTGLAAATIIPFTLIDTMMSTVVAQSRSFYGVLRVRDWTGENGARRTLTHGDTTHGSQFLDSTRRLYPTTYYGKQSGVGLAIEGHPLRAKRPLKVGLVGLGAGTLAVYSRPGELFRFYEINPDVTRIARKHFTFLPAAEGEIEIIEGDARIRLRDEPPQQYDVLVVDAFSSDSIPVHLLTVECGRLYKKHLREDGVLAIHVSNRTLDLPPVVRGMARKLGLSAQVIESTGDPEIGTYSATWMLLRAGKSTSGRAVVWTDDFASIVKVWKR